MNDRDAVPDPLRPAQPHAGDGRRPDADPFLGLTDDARVADAIAARSRQRDLTSRAAEFATLVGTLRDLAESGAGLVVTTQTGTAVRGSAVGLATDHLVIAPGPDHHVFMAIDSIALVRPDPSHDAPVAQGDRAPAQDLLLLERCAILAEDHTTVMMRVRGGRESIIGRLLAVAEDVVTISTHDPRTPIYVAAEAIELVAIDRGLA